MKEKETARKEDKHEDAGKRKFRALTAAAAAIACLVIGTAGLLALDVLPVEEGAADPKNNDSVIEENGSVIIGGDGTNNSREWKAEVTSIEQLPETYRNKIIEMDVPKSFSIEKINFHIDENWIKIKLLYLSKDNREKYIEIEEDIPVKNSTPQVSLNGFEEKKLGEYKIYCKEQSGVQKFAYSISNTLVTVSTNENIGDKEIEAMFASI